MRAPPEDGMVIGAAVFDRKLGGLAIPLPTAAPIHPPVTEVHAASRSYPPIVPGDGDSVIWPLLANIAQAIGIFLRSLG